MTHHLHPNVSIPRSGCPTRPDTGVLLLERGAHLP
jgi:hypothetical protein